MTAERTRNIPETEPSSDGITRGELLKAAAVGTGAALIGGSAAAAGSVRGSVRT